VKLVIAAHCEASHYSVCKESEMWFQLELINTAIYKLEKQS